MLLQQARTISNVVITDETHIQDLLQANNTLSNLIEVLENNFLRSVLESWKQLYGLAIESLRSKHDLSLTPETTTLELTSKVKTHAPYLLLPPSHYMSHSPKATTRSAQKAEAPD